MLAYDRLTRSRLATLVVITLYWSFQSQNLLHTFGCSMAGPQIVRILLLAILEVVEVVSGQGIHAVVISACVC
jgi:hypothetical protein